MRKLYRIFSLFLLLLALLPVHADPVSLVAKELFPLEKLPTKSHPTVLDLDFGPTLAIYDEANAAISFANTSITPFSIKSKNFDDLSLLYTDIDNDNDGDAELIRTDFIDNTLVVSATNYNSGFTQGTVLWSVPTGEEVSSINLVTINGKKKVLALQNEWKSEGSSVSYPLLFVIADNGKSEAFPIKFGELSSSSTSPSLPSTTQNGVLSIDSPLSEIVKAKNSGKVSRMSVGDIDKDGDLDIVFALSVDGNDESTVARSNFESEYLIAANLDGTILSGWPKKIVSPFIPTDSFSRSKLGIPSLVDIDGDSDLEIVYGSSSNKAIYVLHHDATNVQGWPFNLGATEFAINYDARKLQLSDNVVVADLDPAGSASTSQYEIVVSAAILASNANSSENSSAARVREALFVFNSNGELRTGWPQINTSASRSVNFNEPIVLDVDGNGASDIVTGVFSYKEGGGLNVYQADATKLYSLVQDSTKDLKLFSPSSKSFLPSAAAFSDGSKLTLTLGNLYWDMGSVVASRDWPMFGGKSGNNSVNVSTSQGSSTSGGNSGSGNTNNGSTTDDDSTEDGNSQDSTTPLPGDVTIITPTESSVAKNKLSVTWSCPGEWKASGEVYYINIYKGDAEEPFLTERLEGVSTYQYSKLLAAGQYTVEIIAENADGATSFGSVTFYMISKPKVISKIPARPRISLSPSRNAVTEDTTPTIRWKNDVNATSTTITLTEFKTGTEIFSQTFDSATTSYEVPSALTIGTKYRITASSSSDKGSSKSTKVNFYVVNSSDAAPTAVSGIDVTFPSSKIRPLISWTSSDNSIAYHKVLIERLEGKKYKTVRRVTVEYKPTVDAPDLSLQVPFDFLNGKYRVSVTSYNGEGTTVSSYQAFSVKK